MVSSFFTASAIHRKWLREDAFLSHVPVKGGFSLQRRIKKRKPGGARKDLEMFASFLRLSARKRPGAGLEAESERK
ncbi:MAG TPA: hypothetical protein PKC78_12280, partial [Accumulibacter sp.]|uniref:hypothetical protein n=1 Tax=Accumulibacter sp. TaxID=2053492 RepID=UPI002C809B58